MTRIDVPRLRWIFLAAKTCAAIALLFALTMPLTTCTAGGSVQENRVEFSRYEIRTFVCFVWPIPLLLAQFAIARARRSLAILVVESVAVEPDPDDPQAAIATITYRLVATAARQRLNLTVTLSP